MVPPVRKVMKNFSIYYSENENETYEFETISSSQRPPV